MKRLLPAAIAVMLSICCPTAVGQAYEYIPMFSPVTGFPLDGAEYINQRVEHYNRKKLPEKIIAEAKKYLGTPYEWGGTTPHGFDCSGFVQFVFRQNNISLPRTTYTQIKCGNDVPFPAQDNARSGDLVFFGKGSRPRHVGIYIGNNKFIHSPQSGDVVKIQSLSDRKDLIAVKRVITVEN